MLEAIGLIFTRIMQDESPGFDFELVYQMPDGAEVVVTPLHSDSKHEDNRKKLDVCIRKKGAAQQTRTHTIPQAYRPDRIIAYCSGSNHAMDHVLRHYPKAAVANELYGMVDSHESEIDDAYRQELLQHYEQLDVNPQTLYLDATTSKFIIPVLFAVLPMNLLTMDGFSDRERYRHLQTLLLERLGFSMQPVAFSLIIDEDKMSETVSAHLDMLELILSAGGDSRTIYDWASDSQSFRGQTEGEQVGVQEKRVVFLYEKSDDLNVPYYHKALQTVCNGDPFPLLSTLIGLHQQNIIKDIHMSFQREGCQELLEMDALSDGELMWLARMGLILMSQKYCSSNNLFLFDEPDVHFNDDWNKDFVDLLYKMSTGTSHQFIIATHSSLLLTDVLSKQLHLFRTNLETGTTVERPAISTFAAQRERIAAQVFETDAIGSYAQSKIEDFLNETDADKLLDDIYSVGPGYSRFRLYKHYYNIVSNDPARE